MIFLPENLNFWSGKVSVIPKRVIICAINYRILYCRKQNVLCRAPRLFNDAKQQIYSVDVWN